jgi:hypothetical protein
LKKKITSVLVFLASSQALLAFGEDVFNPTKPIVADAWLQKLSAIMDRMFIWL